MLILVDRPSRVGDYTTVTEVPGIGATREQMSMLYTRYRAAAAFSDGKDVLEVGCGAGQGLGYLAAKAGRVVGGDCTEGLLGLARGHYGCRVPLVRLDAHLLPFRNKTFDVVILYEAIYYLVQPDQFLAESRRILRDQGLVLICTANKEWPDFNPSPFSTRYFAAQGLAELLKRQGFSVELYGAFPVSRESAKDRMVSAIKRVAVSLHLIPKTMKAKEVLKRLFFGTLTPLPPEVTDGMADLYPLVPITGNPVISDYKVLYAIGRVR
jgi:ubiquinone/menaquinone biosynthesis C-methylase UbiE